MSAANLTAYEVKVKVRRNGSSIIKMMHIWARTPEQAGKRVKKFGRCIGVQKVHADEMLCSIDRLLINDVPYTMELPQDSPIVMDNPVFQKKNRLDMR